MKKTYIPPTMSVYHLKQSGTLLMSSFDGNSEYPQEFYIINGEIVTGSQVG